MVRQAHHDTESQAHHDTGRHDTLQALCERYGVAVRFDDLGDWGSAELRAEYDPDAAEIRLNRWLPAELVPHAIAHELYHHLEAIGEIAIVRGRRAREAAADAFARALLEANA